MITTDEFLEDFLAHRSDYDPVKAREYYLRTRQLKGRRAARVDDGADPKSKIGYNLKPIVPGKFVNEDETPLVSPTGAKFVDYSDGRASYADGMVFDKNGWSKGAGKSAASRKRRIGQAEQKIIRAKSSIAKVKDPVLKARLTKSLAATERKLKALQSASGS